MEPEQITLTKVFIHNKRALSFGRALYVVGNHEAIGGWNVKAALKMEWEPENNWIIAVRLPINAQIQYKFFESDYDCISIEKLKWDDGPNRILLVKQNAATPNLSVMSFNIRYDNPRDYPSNGWLVRRESVVEVVKEASCDIVAFQEAMPHMTDYIVSELGYDYDIVIRGREWDGKGESTAFLYKKNKFLLLDYGFFWLSNTPYVPGSVYEGSMFPRIVTWGYLREKTTEKNIFFVNNHYEHMPLQEKMRLLSTNLLKDEMQKILKGHGLDERNCSIFITGDFNAGKSEAFYKSMLEYKIPLKDATVLLDPKEKPGTFHSFNGKAGSNQIDFIFYGWSAEWKSYSIIQKKRKDGLYPSDHFPIQATFKLT